MDNTFRGKSFYQQDEIHYFLKMGWVEEGTDADKGKYKLSAKGLKEFDRIVDAMTSKNKLMVKLKVAGNTFTDLKTLF